MEEFTQLFGNLLAFVYHCFDRIVIHGYLSGLSRPEQVVYFFRDVLGLPVVSKEVLRQRTRDYQDWVEAYARNHHLPMEWAEKGVRKEDYVSPRLRRLVKNNEYGSISSSRAWNRAGLSASVSRNIPPRTRTTASWRTNAAVSPITTSTSGMRFWDRWCCGWPPSFPFTPPTGSTATPSSSKNCNEPTSASIRTTTRFSPLTTWPHCKQRLTG